MPKKQSKNSTIYRCGWCGCPVASDGALLCDIENDKQAEEYLKKNRGARVVFVRGQCCFGFFAALGGSVKAFLEDRELPNIKVKQSRQPLKESAAKNADQPEEAGEST